jgi:hypothetical protein
MLDEYIGEHIDSHGKKEDERRLKMLGQDTLDASAVQALASRCVPVEHVYPPKPAQK